MTSKDLHQLRRLLCQMRREHTWSLAGDRNGHDTYRKNIDAVLRDARYLQRVGAFYNQPELELSSPRQEAQ